VARKLQIWNGPGWGRQCYDEGPDRNKYLYPGAASRIYICAHNRRHAARIMAEHMPRESHCTWEDENYKYLRDYAHEGCWGKHMDGIEPEVGIWVATGHEAHPEIKCIWKESDNEDSE